MLPLPAGAWPSTIDALRRQLLEELRALSGLTPRLAVTGEWPVLEALELDLGGLRIDPGVAWPRPRSAVETRAGPSCRQLRMFAEPLRLGDLAQPRFDLRLCDLRFEFIRDEAERHWLRPVAVGGGSIEAGVAESELTRVFLEAARCMSRAQGITIEDAQLRLEPAGSGIVRLEAGIEARKAFLKGRLRFVGTAEFGATLEIHLRGLKCEGIGPVGALAARAVQPHLDRLGSAPFRPGGLLPTGLALERLELKRAGHDRLELVATIAPLAGLAV